MTVSYAAFCDTASTARADRTEETAMKLVQAYADMGCAVYPADVALFTELWGGMPDGWTWDKYTHGHGGFTTVRPTLGGHHVPD